MIIPTEPIGSIPRPPELIAALAAGDLPPVQLDSLYGAAVRDTTTRDTAFANIRARVEGTALAAAILEGRK